ncbi:hypothetical protein PISMIDRAFT_13438 [Pisolithus microcarpus 441]|uniref:Uncharacterized protein n=1 Tax=Pisolithus microcarpus 441 TaxID=765257 RepID=A0A0C9Y4Z8_9AGAM|nr:hypothetical protein PISMIDRAFT_13438 [Pisolithus microcarpus 441]
MASGTFEQYFQQPKYTFDFQWNLDASIADDTGADMIGTCNCVPTVMVKVAKLRVAIRLQKISYDIPDLPDWIVLYAWLLEGLEKMGATREDSEVGMQCFWMTVYEVFCDQPIGLVE